MPRMVELSTGEKVTFRERFTHADELVYSKGLRKGVVIRRYVEDGKEVIEHTPDNQDAALHDTLLVLIDTVKNGEDERKPTEEWLKGLSEPDYADLAEQLVVIRTESRAKSLEGKKNR